MDLALELGHPSVEALRRMMTEAELGQWYVYARTRWLPSRRFEMLLANIARMSAGSDTIIPFIFDPALRELLTPTQVPDAQTGAAAISAIVGGARVIKLGQKRRKHG